MTLKGGGARFYAIASRTQRAANLARRQQALLGVTLRSANRSLLDIERLRYIAAPGRLRGSERLAAAAARRIGPISASC